MMVSALLRVFSLLPLLLLLVQDAVARSQLGSGVRLFARTDQYYPVCKFIISKAARLGGSRAINFLPTQHYLDFNRDAVPDKYCIAQRPGKCENATPRSIKRFQNAMTFCFKYAYNMGFRIFEITPRLDDGQMRSWRNDMKLNPLKNYGGQSYRTLIITPLVKAINTLPASKIGVYFNLQGEMNGPIITHPGEWRALGVYVRRNLKAKAKRIGLNLNFNKVCSWCTGYNFAPNTNNWWERFDNNKINQLFNSMDFVGMSAYAPLWNAGDSYAFSTPSKIENSIFICAAELRNFGVDLVALNKRGKGIHFSEYGLGGGTCDAGNCPARNAEEVAKSPYFGISGPYNAALDPWKNADSRAFRLEYFKNTIRYMAGRGNYNFKVTHFFLWAHGSFDAQGIYPGSTTRAGTWADRDVIRVIFNWNKRGIVP